MAALLYDYTSGYPYLVSRLCRLIDEKGKTGDVWNREGFLEAVRTMMGENNALFESLIGKLSDYPELERMLKDLLFSGKPITCLLYTSFSFTAFLGELFPGLILR